MSYSLGGPVVFFSVSPHGETQEPMVVGQPWALDITSFGLANPETNESGGGAQLKNEGWEPQEEELAPARGVKEHHPVHSGPGVSGTGSITPVLIEFSLLIVLIQRFEECD
jgi:hypothetical protein